MTADLTGLITFLRARYDEREQRAREAAAERSGQWRLERTAGGTHKVVDDLGYSIVEHTDPDSQPWFTTPHIADNDPAYVLADLVAKQEILDYCELVWDDGSSAGSLANFTLRQSGAPFAHHPDYRPEWRP